MREVDNALSPLEIEYRSLPLESKLQVSEQLFLGFKRNFLQGGTKRVNAQSLLPGHPVEHSFGNEQASLLPVTRWDIISFGLDTADRISKRGGFITLGRKTVSVPSLADILNDVENTHLGSYGLYTVLLATMIQHPEFSLPFASLFRPNQAGNEGLALVAAHIGDMRSLLQDFAPEDKEFLAEKKRISETFFFPSETERVLKNLKQNFPEISHILQKAMLLRQNIAIEDIANKQDELPEWIKFAKSDGNKALQVERMGNLKTLKVLIRIEEEADSNEKEKKLRTVSQQALEILYKAIQGTISIDTFMHQLQADLVSENKDLQYDTLALITFLHRSQQKTIENPSHFRKLHTDKFELQCPGQLLALTHLKIHADHMRKKVEEKPTARRIGGEIPEFFKGGLGKIINLRQEALRIHTLVMDSTRGKPPAEQKKAASVALSRYIQEKAKEVDKMLHGLPLNPFRHFIPHTLHPDQQIRRTLQKEKTQTEKSLQDKLLRATNIDEITNVLNEVYEKILTTMPGASAYEQMKQLLQEIPQPLPDSVNNIVFKAVKDSNHDISRQGQNALVALNMKPILASLQPFKNMLDQDELVQEAILAVANEAKTFSDKTALEGTIKKTVQEKIIKYIAREHLLGEGSRWVKSGVYKDIEHVVGKLLQKYPTISSDQVDDFILNLLDQEPFHGKNIAPTHLKAYILSQKALGQWAEHSDEFEGLVEEVAEIDRIQRVLAIPGIFTKEEINIITTHYGLRSSITDGYLGEATSRQMAEKLKISNLQFRLLENSIIRKIYHLLQK